VTIGYKLQATSYKLQAVFRSTAKVSKLFAKSNKIKIVNKQKTDEEQRGDRSKLVAQVHRRKTGKLWQVHPADKFR
jgi:hypothetical protein